MNVMENAIAIKLVQKEIDTKRDFVTKAESLCEIIRKFDGKVFNKRLETALREVYPVRVEYDKVFGWLDITGYIPDRMVQSDEVDRHGYHPIAYIKDDRIYAVSCCKDALDDDGRIVAENIIAKMQATVDYLKESADTLEDQLADIEDIAKECYMIRAKIRDYNSYVKPQIRNYFDLEVRV